MARSLLSSFVSGTRQMLAVQLFVSVGAVSLAGYTLAVTNNVIRERDRLNERVIVLEETLAQVGVMPPAATPEPVREADAGPGYVGTPVEEEVVIDQPTTTQEEAPPVREPDPPPRQEPTPEPPPTRTPTPVDPPRGAETAPTPGQSADATPQEPVTPPQTQNPGLDLAAQVLRDLLTPPPQLRTLVLHIRSRTDYDEAQAIAQRLGGANVRVSIAIMEPNDQTATGYAYYHGRQSRPAAELVQRVQDAARGAEIAAWAVQLRGTALPAQGDYTADRVDVVLPALPAPQQPGTILRVNPQVLQQGSRTQVQPSAVQPQTQPDLRRARTQVQPGVVQQTQPADRGPN